jgi:hypothetical protein
MISNIDKILTHYNVVIIEILLILYIAFVGPHILQPKEQYTQKIINTFKNPFFRCIVLLLIGYIVKINLRLGIFILISFIITNDVINKYQTSKKILHLINNENKLREIKLKELLEPNTYSNKQISEPNIKKMINYEVNKEIIETVGLMSEKSSNLNKPSSPINSANSANSINSEKLIEAINQNQTQSKQFTQSNQYSQINGINYNKTKFADINF